VGDYLTMLSVASLIGDRMSMEHLWHDADRTTTVLGGKPVCATLSTTNLTWTGLGSSPTYTFRLPALSHHILCPFQNPSSILTAVCTQQYASYYNINSLLNSNPVAALSIQSHPYDEYRQLFIFQQST
jgi:hypothetical protein